MQFGIGTRSFKTALAALVILPAILLPSAKALAKFEHQRIRRIVVFPFRVDPTDKDLSKVADETWWTAREKLTESKRFLVASRNFMTAKEVFQPRGELKPADALILGRLLDADALISVFLDDRTLNMRVYETTNGLTLWSGQVHLEPAIPLARQFSDATEKLLYEFLAAIPYQGYVIVDPLINHPTYVEGGNLMFKAEVGLNAQITKGESVQLIRVGAEATNPVFQAAENIEVYAEGAVTSVDRQIITVAVTRRQLGAEIKSGALVRIPDEMQRLQKAFGVQEDVTKNLAVELYKVDDDQPTDEQKKRQPLVTSLAFIGNLALVLLLAF